MNRRITNHHRVVKRVNLNYVKKQNEIVNTTL